MRSPFKMIPYDHQVTALEVQRGKVAFGSFLEQGLGKTAVDLADTGEWFLSGEIRRFLLISPNSVHIMWKDQLEQHLPDDVPRQVFVWRGGLTVKELEKLQWSMKDQKVLTVLLMNVEALSTSERAKALVWTFTDKRTKVTVDESTRIKSLSSQRTKFILKLSRRCLVRRILTGTPVSQSPFDLYSQFLFLDPSILGFSSYRHFCNRYAEYATEIAKKDGKSWQYKKLTRYRRLPELTDLIAPYSVRYLKKDCLDLPNKIYKRIPIQLTPEQRKIYRAMDKDGVAEFDSFEVLTPSRLARLTKMQQICCGFIYDEGHTPLLLPGKNPKLETLLEVVEDHTGKVIVVCRFMHEIDLVVSALKERGDGEVLVMDGRVKASTRKENEDRFQTDPAVRYYVCQEKTLIGWTLTAANTMIYFGQEFSYEARYQSEDRCHRIGLDHHPVYVDLVAEKTVDERIIQVLESCRENAEIVVDRKPVKPAELKTVTVEDLTLGSIDRWTRRDKEESELLWERMLQ